MALDKIYRLTGRLPKRIKIDNGSEFISKALDDAKGKLEAWGSDYNDLRPHSSLEYYT